MKSFPENVKPLKQEDVFSFDCHPGVSCFTECCRELELTLTPYDILRLKHGLKINSQQFLDQYAIIEFETQDQFPLAYLGMIDDGKASCPFIQDGGCRIYKDRPSACRTYPVGRGAFQNKNGITEQIHILINEPHCFGFSEKKKQTIQTWQTDQGINTYNQCNDFLLPIYNHTFFQKGKKLNQQLADKFIVALYNLDTYREQLPNVLGLKTRQTKPTLDDDLKLLQSSIAWLQKELDQLFT